MARPVALIPAVVSLSSILSWLPGSEFGVLAVSMTAVLSAIIAAAIICLGPGALSFDA